MKRKRWMLGVVALVMIVGAAPTVAGPWHAGVRAGAAFADLRGDLPDLAKPDSKLGLAAGGFVTREFAPGVELEVDALYVQKGATFEVVATDEEGNVFTGDSDLELNYLEVPVMLRFDLPIGGAVRPYLIGGGTVNFTLSGKVEPAFGEPEIDIKDDMKSVLTGVTGGLGLRMHLATCRLDLEARYGTEFEDLYDIEDNLESINQTVTVTLAVSR